MNIQGLFPLGLTGLISLLSKGLSRVFSSTTVLKHQFFDTQPPLWSTCHIRTQEDSPAPLPTSQVRPTQGGLWAQA